MFELSIIENSFSKSIKYNYNNKNYNFKILKFSNIEIIDKKYNKVKYTKINKK